jgi:hypothetical protein
MTKRCIDEAILQAYLDGELPREQAAETAAHLAACDGCAAALSEAEAETSLFATVFAPDESVSVPSEVLRARIRAAVAQLEAANESVHRRSGGRSFGGFLASLAGLFTFTPRTAAAFATVLVVVAAALIYFSAQRSQRTRVNPGDAEQVAKVNPIAERPAEVAKPAEGKETAPAATPEKGTGEPDYLNASYPKPHRAVRERAKVRTAAPASPKEEALPGEKDYQAAIASLEKTIKLGGDASLRPSLRAEYERNLALLDAAISQTRSVAAQNPKDKDAVGFLMSAYQSKVELLTKVADQAQVAALGR